MLFLVFGFFLFFGLGECDFGFLGALFECKSGGCQ